MEIIHQIAEQHQRGESLIRLAPKAGMSYYKLRDTMERMGIPLRFGAPDRGIQKSRVSDEDAMKAAIAVIKGDSLDRAAKAVGVTRLTLTRLFERKGWKEKGGPVRLPYELYKATNTGGAGRK